MSRSRQSKSKLALLCSGIFFAVVVSAHATDPSPQCSSQPGLLWRAIAQNPYRELPRYPVNVAGFDLQERGLLQDSVRTLNTCNDLIPAKPKRVHANGLCMLGTWKITEPSPFTGYFRQGSTGAIIMRASVANGWTRRGQYRFFGMAGKVFPTTDLEQATESANWFTLASPARGFANRFLDVDLTNDVFYIPPPISRIPGLGGLITAFQTATLVPGVFSAFVRADRAFVNPTRIAVRQLYPVAELGEASPRRARSPQWFRIEAPRSVRRVNQADFRDELRAENYPDGLRFQISVADVGLRIGAKLWRRIGVIDVAETVASPTCDQRLHFAHPKWRNALGRVGAQERANELLAAAEEWSQTSRELLATDDGIDLALDQTIASIDALESALGQVRFARDSQLIPFADGNRAESAITSAVDSLTRAEESLGDGDRTAAGSLLAAASGSLSDASAAMGE